MGIHRLPNLEDVRREASEWIVRLHSDEVSTEDLARFDAWRRAHPLHESAYEELLATWQRFAQAAPSLRASVAAERAVNSGKAVPIPRSWNRHVAVAASVTAMVLLAVFSLRKAVAPTVYSTAIGEQATVTLSDGSSLTLNSNSRVHVNYLPDKRVVHLDRGEAFFTIAHDANRPFWVRSGDCWVRALGTQFDVYRKATNLQVTVSEGRIRVGADGKLPDNVDSGETHATPFATLSAGQQVDLSSASAITRELSGEDLARVVSWRRGTLYFENRRLGEVVAELNRYTPRQIFLSDERLVALPIGGTFRASPEGAETLLRLLEQSLDVRVDRKGDRVFVRAGSAVPSAHPAELPPTR